MPSSHAILELGLAYAMSSLHAVLELAMHMSCNQCMQFPSSWHICHALITCSSGACAAYAMPPLYAVLEYILGIWHAIIKCNFGACNAYVMHPVIALYCIVLLCVTMYYFHLLCIPLHSKPYRNYGPYSLGPLRHALCHHYIWFWSLSEHMPYPSYMQFCSLGSTCHAIIACSFWTCSTYVMPSLYAVLELAWYMPYHYYMQVWGAQDTYHAIIKCNVGA